MAVFRIKFYSATHLALLSRGISNLLRFRDSGRGPAMDLGPGLFRDPGPGLFRDPGTDLYRGRGVICIRAIRDRWHRIVKVSD